jgi:hypothetical protein
MKRKMYRLAICLLVIGNSSFAQWGGSSLDADTYHNGNVGIGTSTPTAKLDVNIFNQNSTTPQYGLLLRTNTFFTWANAGNSYFLKTSDPGNTNATFVIKGNGNVGIGTENPVTQLHINVGNYGSILLGNSTNEGVAITKEADNRLAIWNNGIYGSSQTERFTILQNGNVGIGTNNPGSYKLAVEGKIAARGIKVTTASFADYVFDSTYRLRSLSNLEQYINQNKHRPGMPSAAQVQQDGGIELEEMNIKLLEKVEELTLYVIELKKENEQIKKQLKKQSNRAERKQ